MIGSSLYSLLSGHAPLVALVGTQIYPVQAPQAKKDPMVIYGIVKQEGQHSKARLSVEDWSEVEVVVYAKEYNQVHTISAAVRVALDGKKGTLAGKAVSQISFMSYEDAWEEERESFAGISIYQVITAP